MTKSFSLEGFEPIKRIGGGGFGDVWLAKQTNVDRDVAVKVGHAPIQDETIRLRFERECKALGRLSGHPNIVDVFTAGTLDDGRPYLVLEYIDGGTLWERLKRSPMNDDELVHVGEELAGALSEAHASGVLHRDLKPENILMRSSGDAVLGDFGIARLQDGMNTTSAAITASVAYAAPEVLSGTHASSASDLYGIGICLLAVIIRSVPFVEKSDKSIHPIITRVMTNEPPDLRRMGVGEDLAKVIDVLLQKDPDKRPASAIDVQETFRNLRMKPWQADQHLLTERNTGSSGRRATTRTMVPMGDGLSRPKPAVPPVPGGQPVNIDLQTTVSGGPPPLKPERSPAAAPNPPPRLEKPVQTPLSQPVQKPISPRSNVPTPAATEGAPGANIKAFAVAYIATVAVGVLIIFVLAQVLG